MLSGCALNAIMLSIIRIPDGCQLLYMKVYILVDWEINQIIGVYINEKAANNDRARFIDKSKLEVIKRDLIEDKS